MVDVCALATASPDAGAYWRKLKQRFNTEGGQPVKLGHDLKLRASDDKQLDTYCANTLSLLNFRTFPSRVPVTLL